MIADTLTPAARVLLDRRITEERMIALDPPYRRPDWLHEMLRFSYVPHAFVMEEDGVAPCRRQLADEIDWHRAVAVRFETPWGLPIDLEDASGDEDYH